MCKQWFIVNAKREVKEAKEITKRNGEVSKSRRLFGFWNKKFLGG
jgi:hypothetical protein